MAAMLPSMNRLKTMVSKNRNRHKEHGFDLDLTYITDRIIAMAYPAERVQSIYRNHLNDVYDFLELKHKDHYYIYNLCSEKSYDKAKFCNRVKVYPFDDHNPPSFVIIRTFCEDVDGWLRADPENVIAIHCKAGKGRTGTMICCYLLHCGIYSNADEVIEFYGKMRTQDGHGVTIPSQIRYVRYYAKYLQGQLTYIPRRINIKKIVLKPAPKFSEPVLYTVRQKLEDAAGSPKPKLSPKEAKAEARKREECRDSGDPSSGKTSELTSGFKSPNFGYRPKDPEVVLDDQIIRTVSGDVRIELFYRPPVVTKKKRFARIWINTFFVDFDGTRVGEFERTLTFQKNELDIAGKKDKNHKLLSENFKVIIHIKVPSEEEIQDELNESKKKQARKDQEEDSSGTEDDSEDENDSESGSNSKKENISAQLSSEGTDSTITQQTAYHILSNVESVSISSPPDGSVSPMEVDEPSPSPRVRCQHCLDAGLTPESPICQFCANTQTPRNKLVAGALGALLSGLLGSSSESLSDSSTDSRSSMMKAAMHKKNKNDTIENMASFNRVQAEREYEEREKLKAAEREKLRAAEDAVPQPEVVQSQSTQSSPSRSKRSQLTTVKRVSKSDTVSSPVKRAASTSPHQPSTSRGPVSSPVRGSPVASSSSAHPSTSLAPPSTSSNIPNTPSGSTSPSDASPSGTRAKLSTVKRAPKSNTTLLETIGKKFSPKKKDPSLYD